MKLRILPNRTISDKIKILKNKSLVGKLKERSNNDQQSSKEDLGTVPTKFQYDDDFDNWFPWES